MELPKSRSGVDNSYNKAKLAILGPGGCGKTGMLCGDKDVLIIDTEGGMLFYDNFTIEARSMKDISLAIAALTEQAKKSEPFPYSGVFLDTIDKVVGFANSYTTTYAKGLCKSDSQKDTIKDVGSIPSQMFNGYNFSRALVNRVLDSLEKLPCASGFVGHVEMKQIEEPNGSKYFRKSINIGGKMGIDLMSWADHTLLIDPKYSGEMLKRKIRTKPSQGIDAKSRGGLIPDLLEINGTNEENWKKIRSFFT